jgi:hypothetical protein
MSGVALPQVGHTDGASSSLASSIRRTISSWEMSVSGSAFERTYSFER